MHISCPSPSRLRGNPFTSRENQELEEESLIPSVCFVFKKTLHSHRVMVCKSECCVDCDAFVWVFCSVPKKIIMEWSGQKKRRVVGIFFPFLPSEPFFRYLEERGFFASSGDSNNSYLSYLVWWMRFFFVAQGIIWSQERSLVKRLYR